MARLDQDSLSKKSNKFDNFLKKNLDEQTFHRVRGYEACIVCSEKESKAFKFVVLSDEYIYLTENPPKTITKAVRLRDTLSIELLDALPEFLSGQEQLNTQHIGVTYLTTAFNDKDKATRVALPSTSSLPEELSSVPDNYNHRHGEHTSKKTNATSLTQSMPASSLKSLLRTKDGCNEDGRKSRKTKKVVTIVGEQQATAESQDATSSANKRVISSNAGTRIDDTLLHLNLHSSGDHSSESSAWQALSWNGSLLSPASQPPSSNDEARISHEQGIARRAQQEGKVKKHSASVESSAAGAGQKLKSVVLHLYMLRSNSTMFALIQSAASNCIIRSTMMLDEDYRQRVQQSPRRLVTSEKVEMQFSCLATELMDSSNTIEQIFVLMQELKTATEKDFLLKKLFWRSPDLFCFIVRLMQKFMPRSPFTSYAGTTDAAAGRARRADEFE